MPRHRGTVLVDTNVILEAHWTGSWRALTGGCRVETVEDCVTETQTGFQRRRPERQVDETELRSRLATARAVADLQRSTLAIRAGDIALDRGEASLWAHALGRDDEWILCGPDKRPVSVAASDWGCATGWHRWKDCSTTSAIGRQPPCATRTQGDGTRARLSSWFWPRETGIGEAGAVAHLLWPRNWLDQDRAKWGAR